ncbi:MAG TPA: MBL fold metallo-hydrolase [Microscillaceae bacterium]|nr:MBL fold metallo-hydrolase [Microscillaceae bacterium]
MKIEQFFDEGLAHSSYAILSDNQVALVDPARDPQPYYDFAAQHNASIVAVFETHPHADFVSSHFEIHQTTGATIYASKLLGAEYPHQSFDDDDAIQLGKIKLYARNTPGHSPDSITIFATNEQGKDYALFTGDTLFVGDVGRPDLRENVGNMTAKREELAKKMYQSTREIFLTIQEDLLVYPAHGAGSLCGKGLSTERYSSLHKEFKENYALQPMNEAQFVQTLLDGQPYIPKYFGYNVDLNKKGAPAFAASVKAVKRLPKDASLAENVLVVDARQPDAFKAGHLPQAINIPDGKKFETWLGSIVAPTERFYLIADSEQALNLLIAKAAKIGYEALIEAATVLPTTGLIQTALINLDEFIANPKQFNVLDVRNRDEVAADKPFSHSYNIPLTELRDRLGEVPADKALVVHCAAGYRSAVASSIVRQHFPQVRVLDLSEAIQQFKGVQVV